MEHSKPGYRADVDGLRAVAIVSVVAYHAGLPVPGGFTGVDIFFVISGFLITQLLHHELAVTGSISIVGFYARRVRRLLPALTVVLAATLATGTMLLPPFGEVAALGRSALAASAFVANEYFRLFSGGYFDAPAALLPLLHLWSLAVEEQFYLLWPWLIVAVGFAVPVPRRRHTLAICVAIGSILSFLLGLELTSRESPAAFFFIGARAWELGIGAWLALMQPRARPPILGASLGLAGCAAIGAAFWTLGPGTPFPGFAALLPVLGTALVVHAGSLTRGGVTRLLSTRPMVTIGLLSYSWYLWHWPMLALARSRRLGEDDLAQDCALALAALVLAALTYRYVENPVRYGARARALSPPRTVAIGTAALATVALLALAVWKGSELTPRSATVQRAWDMYHDRSPHQVACALAPRQWSGVVPLAGCTITANGRPSQIAIWGDSHADAWSPLLQAPPSHSYVQLSMNACPPLLGVVPVVPGIRATTNCRSFNDAVIRFLESPAAATIRGVILAARWTAYAGQSNISVHDEWIGYPDQADRTAAEALSSIRRSLAGTLSALEARRLRVLVILPAPEFRYAPPRCLLVRTVEQCGIARDDYERHRTAVTHTISEVAAHFSNVRVADPAEYFCNERACLPYRGNHASLRDDDHVTASAARGYARVISDDLTWLTGGQALQRQARDPSPERVRGALSMENRLSDRS